MTISVADKVQQRTRRKPRPMLPRAHSSSRSRTKTDSSAEKEIRVCTLALAIEDVALGYFMTTYAPTTPFEYLPEIWSTFAADETARIATYAPALASLALESQQPELTMLARRYYAEALTRTNHALRNPQRAVLDSTLLKVLLLSAFEGLTFRGRTSPKSWMAHIHGAATLLILRGEGQLDTELGQKLFHHVRLNIGTCCSQQLVPVPAELDRLHVRAKSLMDSRSPRFRMAKVLDRLAALRAGMRGMAATKVVREAMDLDRETADLLSQMKRLSFKVVSAADSPVEACTYKGYMYHYNSQNAARYWNLMRMLRLFFNEWIFCAFDPRLRGVVVDRPEPGDPLAENWDRLPALARATGEEMIDGVLAGVPFSLECLEKPSRISARFLIWPLASIGASELCPGRAKEFVIDRLRALSGRHNLDQANEAATMLEEGAPIEDW